MKSKEQLPSNRALDVALKALERRVLNGTQRAQDAVGGILQSTTTIILTYDGAGHIISADVQPGSIGPTELTDTGVTPGTYGDSTHTVRVTVDADGRITAIEAIAITAPESSGYFSPLTTGGDPATAELVFGPDGDVVDVFKPI